MRPGPAGKKGIFFYYIIFFLKSQMTNFEVWPSPIPSPGIRREQVCPKRRFIGYNK